VLRYDPGSDRWSNVAPMPSPRYNFGSWVLTSDVYVFGGLDHIDDDTDTVYRYNTETNKWSTLVPMSGSRGYCHRVCVLDGKVYVVGGRQENRTLCIVCMFDPGSSSWSTVASMCVTREDCDLFVLGGCMYATGGYAGTPLSSVEKYEPATDMWTMVGPMKRGVFHHRVETVRLEANLFDALIGKAETGWVYVRGS
jgi:hypothetical protein